MNPRTFIFHDGALGDILLSLPSIRLIRDSSSFLHLACRPDAAELLKEAGFADQTSDSGSVLFSPLHDSRLTEKLKGFLSSFDRAFVFTARADSPLPATIKTIIADTSTVLTVPPTGTHMHVSWYRLQQVGSGVTIPRQTSLEIPSLFRERAYAFLSGQGIRDLGRPLVAVHPGSGSIRKNWPIERFFQVIEKLSLVHSPLFLLITGPAENEKIKSMVEDYVNDRRNCARHVSGQDLVTVAGLLSMCSLYIGNDSGITHLASLIRNNVIALYGPTDPVLWGPSNARAIVLSSGSPCSPFEDSGRSCPHIQCLSDISAERVSEHASLLLGL